MKIGNQTGGRSRRGILSLAIGAGVIAAVILFNVLATFVFHRNLWYTDLSADINYDNKYYNAADGSIVKVASYTSMYRLMPETVSMMKEVIRSVNESRDRENPAKVDIIFCADPDMVTSNVYSRFVYYTARALEKRFPGTIRVSTRDVWKNPSSVDEFRANAYSSIYQNNVIVASGSEFRVLTTKSFYMFDSATATTPWVYNGEKKFVQSIMAVTMAEAPVCALTVNHGEPFATEEGRAEYSEFLKVVKNAGYKVEYLDLSSEPIPDDCRLIVTFDPQTDFVSYFRERQLLKALEKLAAENTVKVETRDGWDAAEMLSGDGLIVSMDLSSAHLTAYRMNSGRDAVLRDALIRLGYSLSEGTLPAAGTPECRILLNYDAASNTVRVYRTTDLLSSEQGKLDEYLSKSYSYLLFADADTPSLPILEEYLGEWGIAFARYEGSNYLVTDPDSAVNTDGSVFAAQYETAGFGASVTSDMRGNNVHPKILFGNATAFTYSDTFQETYVLADKESGEGAYTYGSYFGNASTRGVFDVFRAGKNAVAAVTDAGGAPLTGDTSGSFRLMVIAEEMRNITQSDGYTSINDPSYVAAVGSTYFASNDVLKTNTYGNTDVLLSLLRSMGSEIDPVGLSFKVLADGEMSSTYCPESTATRLTVILSVVPAALLTVAGSLLLVRRKVRH